MNPPQSLKQVQKLTGCVAALTRFISGSADKCLPFFNVIRNRKKFEWTPLAEKDFEELKRYHIEMPRMTSPNVGEVLELYLAIS